jgi:hypothetical protein
MNKVYLLILAIITTLVFLISLKSSKYVKCERFYRDTRGDSSSSYSSDCRKVHIATFGDGAFLNKAKEFALFLEKKFPNFHVHRYDMGMVDDDFKQKNKDILSNSKGFGYWLWKPYICKQIFDSMNYGDILWYIDGGLILKDDVDFENIIKWCSQSKSGGLVPEQDTPQGKFCRKEVFVQLDMDYSIYSPLMQCASGFFLIQKRHTNEKIIQEWLNTACIPGMIDDSPSKYSTEWNPITHRHDQAIFSLLAHKYGFDVLPAANEGEWPFYRRRPPGYKWQKFWQSLFG